MLVAAVPAGAGTTIFSRKDTMLEGLSSLYSAIINASSSIPAVPSFAAAGTYVTTEAPASAIDAVQFANPWSPATPTGSQTALENFSALVDPIPQLSRYYASTGRSTEEVYSLALGAAPVDLTPQTVSDIRQADPDVTSALELAQLENKRNNAAARVALLSATPGSDADTDSARLELDRTEAAIRKAAPTHQPHLAVVTGTSVAQAFVAARAVFARTERARVDDPGFSYHPAYATPLNFAGSADEWSAVSLPLHQGSGLTASLKFLRVDVARPWLKLALFSLEGWRVAGIRPGGFSNGDPTNNPGLLPLITTALVAVRDVVITRNDNVVLSVRGIRILARINAVIPFSPPA